MTTDYGLDPMGRNRFYGIYEATVTNVTDPLKRNRIQVTVEGPTGSETTGWARAVLPITDSSYHPDHKAHTAAQIAALLTTSTSTTGSGGSPAHTHTIPALTIVPKSSSTSPTNQLNHTHVTTTYTKTTKTGNVYTVAASPSTTTDSKEASKYAGSQTAPDGTTTPEHTFHRTVPVVGQKVWVMFIAGDPEYPVWIGVQS